MIYAISSLITAVMSIVLGIFVLSKNVHSRQNQLWFLASSAIFTWTFSLYWCFESSNIHQALLWQRILYVGTALIPIFFYHYTLLLTGREIKQGKSMIFGYMIALCFISMVPGNLMIVKALPKNEIGYWPVLLSNYYYGFLAYFAIYAILGFIALIKGQKEKTGISRMQIKFVLYAALVGYIGGSFNFLLDYNFNYPIGNLFVSSYVIIIAYAITRYRLMGIKTLLSNLMTYSILAILTEVIFYTAIWIEDRSFGSVMTGDAVFYGLFISLAFVAIFLRVKTLTQKFADDIFYQGRNPQSTINEIIIKSSQTTDSKSLINLIVNEITNDLDVEDCHVCLNFENQEANKNTDCDFFSDESAKAFTASVDDVIVIDEYEIIHGTHFQLSSLKKHNIQVLVPLRYKDSTFGMILVEKKINETAFSKEDIVFLKVVSSQVSIAFINAYIHDNLENMVAMQTEKLTNANSELLKNNKYLTEVLSMRTNFLNIASHQLQTPVSIIKGMASMIANDNLSINEIKTFSKNLLEKSDKLSDIISNILLALEAETEKYEINSVKIKLSEILIEAVAKSNALASKKGAQVLFTPPPPNILVKADKKYLLKAYENIIENAIKFCPTGTGIINITSVNTGKTITTKITDNGIGIPKEEWNKLFEKFSRGNNAHDTYVDGSGLGLFIANKIITAHLGKVQIESSEIGKGTTITIELPTS